MLSTPFTLLTKEETKRACVYVIYNIDSNKKYVGSTINISVRNRCHWNSLRRGKHHSVYLQREFNIYGENKFVLGVLEWIELTGDISYDKGHIIEREQYHIDTLNAYGADGYNMIPCAGTNLGSKRTEESVERMRQAHLGEKHTPERIAKQVASRAWYTHSSETREHIGNGNRGKERTIEQKEKQRLRRHTQQSKELISIKKKGQKYGPAFSEKQRNRKWTPKERREHELTFFWKNHIRLEESIRGDMINLFGDSKSEWLAIVENSEGFGYSL